MPQCLKCQTIVQGTNITQFPLQGPSLPISLYKYYKFISIAIMRINLVGLSQSVAQYIPL